MATTQGAAGAAPAATINVPCRGAGGGAAGLVGAVDQANASPGPDTINLAGGCSYVLTAADNPGNGLPVVTGQVSIRGNGATIRRSSPSPFRIFDVGPGANVNLDRLTITGGLATANGATAYGGGIFNEGTLSLSDAVVKANTVSGSGASAGGGGIANQGVATLSHTEVLDNTAAATGTLIFAAVGGGVINRAGATMTMRDSEVAVNTATSTGSSPILFIAAAGGIGSSGDLTVSRTKVVGNRVLAEGLNGRGNGGGISIQDGTFNIDASTIQANVARATGSGAQSEGGGLENFGTARLTATTVTANRATSPSTLGGGIYNGADLALAGSPVRANVANGIPGGDPPAGGGIYNDGGNVTLSASPVTGNHPDNCEPPIAGC
ncbi:MAG: hypothetical protein ACR2HY_05915 [Acidimicrobiales bacterium]